MIDLIKGVWPFVSEIFFAGKSFKNIVMENKILSVVLAFLLLSLSINYMAISKIWDIAVTNRKEKINNTPQKQPTELVIEPPKPVKPPPDNPCGEVKESDSVREKLQSIYKD